jgi:osmotically-inducible protein OsmY
MTRFLQLMLAAVTVATLACGGARVHVQAPAAPDDNTLAVRVRTSLANAPDVHPSEVQVEVTGGVVVLKGDVHGEREINAAIEAARRVSGVRDVKSELKSKP